MNDVEERRKQFVRERERAQQILDDPNSDQLARDLAHLRLQHEEGTSGSVASISENTVSSEDVPQEWLEVELWESDFLDLSDEEVVSLVEDPLLRNKCTRLKAAVGPDGKPSVVLAYPKLTRAVKRQLNNSSSDQQKVASANAVMACLIRAADPATSVEYFKNAIRIRPDDWRLRNALASSYMSQEKISLALEALTQAVELTPVSSLERFEVESCRGKVLFNLGRNEEAKVCFLSVLVAADKYKDKLSALDVGHLVPMEYMLCAIWAMEKNEKMCKHRWDSAEAKRNALPADVRQRIDWDSRQFAQTLMACVNPHQLLSHQECHNCRKLCPDLQRCTGCNAALYCSRECQVAAWKAGHKKQCKTAKQNYKDQKKEQKAAIQKIETVRNLPPLDATLDPYDLWAKAKKLSQETGKAEDAVFYFTVALFLDFSLDAQDMKPAKAVVDASDPDHPLTLALGMITHMDRSDPLGHSETHHHKALDYIGKSHGNFPPEYDTSESLEQVDRVQFGVAMCTIFRARIVGRFFAVRSMEQALSTVHKEGFDSVLKLINQFNTFLPTERWLTIQFELGYSNLDVGAANEAKHRLDMFVNNLAALKRANGKLSKHWKQMRNTARSKLQMVQLMQVAQQSGMMP